MLLLLFRLLRRPTLTLTLVVCCRNNISCWLFFFLLSFWGRPTATATAFVCTQGYRSLWLVLFLICVFVARRHSLDYLFDISFLFVCPFVRRVSFFFFLLSGCRCFGGRRSMVEQLPMPVAQISLSLCVCRKAPPVSRIANTPICRSTILDSLMFLNEMTFCNIIQFSVDFFSPSSPSSPLIAMLLRRLG